MSAFLSSVRRDPILAFLLVFAVAATVLYGAPARMREVALPYTGWVGLAVPYSFLIFFAAYSLGARDSETRRRMRLGCSAMLAVGAVSGVAQWMYLGGARTSSNPYLRVSPWRPIWAVLLPLLWIALLYWRRPRNEDASPSDAQEAVAGMAAERAVAADKVHAKELERGPCS